MKPAARRVLLAGPPVCSDEEQVWAALSRLPSGTVLVLMPACGAAAVAGRLAGFMGFATERVDEVLVVGEVEG